jgi:cytochrome oxidase Cu insertion factor (SCO1/SenC/PrrC family)
MSSAVSELRARNLRTLAALAALFLLPLAVAFFTYYGSTWRPAHRVNHGVLILPARTLPQVALPRDGDPQAAGTAASAPFRGRWSLVYVGRGACDTPCRGALYVMRQTRLALNNDMTRVERVFLVSGDCCDRAFLASEHPGLLVLDATGADARPLLEEFPSPGLEHTLFVVDPLGNLMMSYDARRDPHGLLEDLKKLLKLSHIG